MEHPLNRRQGLIEQVQRGELSAEKAEELARQEGLPPLRNDDWQKYHPDRLPRWTLAMALAWIAWRHPEPVAGFDREYLEHFSTWGVRTVPLPSTSGASNKSDIPWLRGANEPWVTANHVFLLLTKKHADLSGHPVRARDPWLQLRRALVDGRLVAEGVPEGKFAPVEIPAIEFTRLEIVWPESIHDEALGYHPKHGVFPSKIAYRDFAVKPSDMKREWRDDGRRVSRNATVSPTPALVKQFEQYAVEYFARQKIAPPENVWDEWRRDLNLSRDNARALRGRWPERLRRGVGAKSAKK